MSGKKAMGLEEEIDEKFAAGRAALERWKKKWQPSELALQADAILAAAQWEKSQPASDRGDYIYLLMGEDQPFGNRVFAALPNLELESLNIIDNEDPKSIPEGLNIEGCLGLWNCPGIVSLPAALTVGHLHLSGCPNWDLIRRTLRWIHS
jgi:hypothetical protein